MQIFPDRSFNGHCRQALAFYRAHLGGSERSTMPYRDAPEQGHVAEQPLDLPMRASVRLGGALAQGGATTMPLRTTFFASRFGMLTDQFGVPWMVMSETQQSARRHPPARAAGIHNLRPASQP